MERKAGTAIQIFVAVLGSAFVIGYCLRQPLTLLRILGIVLAIISVTFWTVARVQIGGSFSIQPKATKLVKHGIYSKIRNPIYVFSALWLAGMVLALGKPLWLAILLVLAPIQVIRSRKEARVLEAKFAGEYREYRRTTWF